ncbi:MAG TPA: transposase, partial [Armatimonadota bacterium]|nr:transposase [Armatimonadota bacterium]
MPFGKKAVAVRAYAYGCTNPTDGAAALHEQSALRCQLWNALVALEIARREKVEGLWQSYCADHAVPNRETDGA